MTEKQIRHDKFARKPTTLVVGGIVICVLAQFLYKDM